MGPRDSRFLKLLLAFGAIYFIWGSNFLAIRFAVETLPPLLVMASRHLGAGLLLMLLQIARGRWHPEPRLWRSALFSGTFCFLGCHGLLAWAEIRVPSGLAALLAASLPIWMILFARLWGQGSELTPGVLSGIALGLFGVGLLVPLGFATGPGAVLSTVAVIVSEMFWAVGAIYARGVKTPTSPSTFAAMQMLCGGAVLCAVGLSIGEGSAVHAAAFTTRAVVSIAFMTLLASLVSFTAYTWLLQVTSPALVSTHSYVNPVVAVAVGWALGGEAVTGRTVLGATIVLASVALLSLRPKQAHKGEGR